MTDINIANITIDNSKAVSALNEVDKHAKKTADTAQRESNKVKSSFDSMSSGIGGIKSGVTIATAAIAGTTAAIGALYAIGAGLVDQHINMAKAMQGSVGAIQTLELAANNADVSMEAISAATQKLNIALSDSDPNSKASQAIAKLGLNSKALLEMDVDQRLVTIAQRFNELGYSQAQSVAALGEMGVKGKDLIKIMDEGAAAIAAAKQEINRYGLALTDVDVARLKQSNDAFDSVKGIISNTSKVIAAEMAPAVTALSRLFIGAAEDGGGIGEKVRGAMDIAIKGVGKAINVVDVLWRMFRGLVLQSVIMTGSLRDGFVDIARAVIEYPVEAVNTLIRAMNSIPGVEIPEVDASNIINAINTVGEVNQAVTDEARSQLNGLFTTPPAGNVFLDELEKIKAETANVKTGLEGAGAVIAAPEDKKKKEKELSDADKYRKDTEDKFEAIKERNLGEAEALQAKYDQERIIVEEAERLGVKDAQAISDARLGINKRQMEEETAIIKKKADEEAEAEKKKRELIFNAVSTGLADVSTLMDSNSRKQFEIGKAAAISKAIIDTQGAASGAYYSLSSIPFVGPALGAAAAAAAIISGMSRVKAIKSQKFGGGGGGTASATASATAGGGGGSLPPAYPGAGGAQTRTTNINIAQTDRSQGLGSDTAEMLFAQINKASKDGRVNIGYAS